MRLFEQEKSTQDARQPLATISSNNQDTSCYLCRVVRARRVGRWSRPTLAHALHIMDENGMDIYSTVRSIKQI